MKNIGIIICFILINLNNANAQKSSNEDLYLEVLNAVLSEQIYDLNENEIYYENDTCFFFSRSDSFVKNTEKIFEFNYKTHSIKVWPSDYVFFYDITTYVKINNCNILNNEAVLNFESYVERILINKKNVILIKKNGKWKVKKIETE